MSVFVGILGELQVRVNGRPVAVSRGKQQLLLAALTLRHGRFVSTEELVDLLWGEHVPPSARTTLRGYVRRLRDRLRGGGAAIEALPGGYRLVVDDGDIDLRQFRRLCRQAHTCADLVKELAMVRAALELWRGRALSGLDPLPWVGETTSGLEEEWLQAVERRSDLEIGAGLAQTATVELRRVLPQHPYRESLWSRLILALHRAGRTAEALLAYDEVRALLSDELGVDPSAPLQALYQHILTNENTTTTRATWPRTPRRAARVRRA